MMQSQKATEGHASLRNGMGPLTVLPAGQSEKDCENQQMRPALQRLQNQQTFNVCSAGHFRQVRAHADSMGRAKDVSHYEGCLPRCQRKILGHKACSLNERITSKSSPATMDGSEKVATSRRDQAEIVGGHTDGRE